MKEDNLRAKTFYEATQKAEERQTAREAKSDVDIDDFNVKGQAISNALGRQESRTAAANAALDEFNQGSQARNRVFQRQPVREAKSDSKMKEDNLRAQAFHDAKEKLEETYGRYEKIYG